jgi:uncharacterized protein (TIGR02231 family)
VLFRSLNVRGTGEGVIQSVRHRVSYLNRTEVPKQVQALQDSVDALQQALAVLNDEQFVNQSEEKLLLANQQLAGQQQGLDVETLRQTAALLRERLTAVRANLRRITQEKEAIDRRMRRINAEVTVLRMRRDQPTQEVVVVFKADEAGELKLELAYLVSQARWNPFYDLRVAAVGEPIQLALKANVINDTGIDWPQVAVKLSTTQNAGNNATPELGAQNIIDAESALSRDERLRLEQEMMRLKKEQGQVTSELRQRTADSRANTISGGLYLAEDAEATQATTAADYTTTSEGELGLEFDIALRYDLPADGQPHQVDILQSDLPAEYHHYAVPKLDRDAFLVADIREDLLRGPANVYFEGTFVGETRIDTDNPRDSMRISLGRDPKVQVQREQVKDYTASQVIGGKVKQTFAYEITLRNNKAEAVNLTLQDQIPVSQTKYIEVTPEELSGASLDAATGRLTWNLSLPPGEARTLRFSYEVKHPKDMQVVGL